MSPSSAPPSISESFDHIEVIDYGDAHCPHGMVQTSLDNIRTRVHEIASRKIVWTSSKSRRHTTWLTARSTSPTGCSWNVWQGLPPNDATPPGPHPGSRHAEAERAPSTIGCMNRPIGERPGMAAYGVNSPKWEALPWEWAAERLTPNKNYWVVTVSTDGAPQALPVWGVWTDQDLRFMFSCAPTARKARNIAANPRVVFTVDSTVECISVEGVAAPITDPARPGWTSGSTATSRSTAPRFLTGSVTSSASTPCSRSRRPRLSQSSSARTSSPTVPLAGVSPSRQPARTSPCTGPLRRERLVRTPRRWPWSSGRGRGCCDRRWTSRS